MSYPKPRVYLTPEAFRKLTLYIGAVNGEISGRGRVSTLGNDFLVEEVTIFEQDVSSGHTTLSEGKGKNEHDTWLYEMVKAGGNPEEWKLWWHSHGNGGAYFSSTDDNNMDGWDNGWMLGHVGTRSGKHRFRLDVYEPRITLDELEWKLWVPSSQAEVEEVKEEVKAKVKEKAIVTSYGWHGDYGDWWSRKKAEEDNVKKEVTTVRVIDDSLRLIIEEGEFYRENPEYLQELQHYYERQPWWEKSVHEMTDDEFAEYVDMVEGDTTHGSD